MSAGGHIIRNRVAMRGGVDLDNLIVPGIYAVETPTNGPDVANYLVEIHVAVNDPIRIIVQKAVDLVEGTAFIRLYDGSIWGDWAGFGSGGGGGVRVRAATTVNIVIATELNDGDTIDGVLLVADDLVLVKNQDDAEFNGVYEVGPSPERASGLDDFDAIAGGSFQILEGSVNADTMWLCTSDPGGTIDVDDLVFAPRSQAVDNDTTLSADSASLIPSQHAVKTYVDNTADSLSNDIDDAEQNAKDASIPITYLDTDGTLASDSDTKVATQKALKTYVDQIVAANDAMVFKGVIDASANPNFPAADRGWTYRISVAGKIGGASGTVVEAGDLIVCLDDSTSSGTLAAQGTHWTVVQTNIDGAVVGPASATDGHFAQFDTTSGKLIKGGIALDTDGTLAANSDTNLASQRAIKTYVDQIVAANDAMVFKGVIDASSNPNFPAADRGWTYRISVAGKIGGGSGTNVEAGDLIVCLDDSTSAGTLAAQGTHWTVVQTNLDGAVIGPASATDSDFAQFDTTSGKLLKGGLSRDTDGTLAANSDTRIASQKATKTYADTKIASSFLDTDGTLAANSDSKIATQKATKTYADAVASTAAALVTALAEARRVRAATIGSNITISTALNNGDSLDGVTLATGDLVLVKDQSSPAENGIYVVGVSPARDVLYDTYNEHVSRMIMVDEGAINADTLWKCTSNRGGTLNTTAISYSKVIDFATLGGGLSVSGGQLRSEESLVIAVGDETTEITADTEKVTFRMPYALTVTSVKASLNVASSSGAVQVDINENSVSILSTPITIDQDETTTATATTAAVVSDTALAADSIITIDVDSAGVDATGLKVTIIGYRP